MTDAPLPQRVVVYDGEKPSQVFQTVYTDEEASEAIIRCAKQHGTFSNVRAIPAAERLEGT